nr:PREDICTED: protein phosphatase 2C-like domain-containing protein 1 isoform X1 [Lepisosteus oculatus]
MYHFVPIPSIHHSQDQSRSFDEDKHILKEGTSNKTKEGIPVAVEKNHELTFKAHVTFSNKNVKQACTTEDSTDAINCKHKTGCCVTTFKVNHPVIKAVASCEDKNAVWKQEMEDMSIFIERYGSDKGAYFIIGLCDGFHGRYAADITSKELPVIVLEQLSKCLSTYSLTGEDINLLESFETIFQEDCKSNADQIPPFSYLQVEDLSHDERVHMAFAKAFRKMDRILGLGRNETSKIRWSGCTALICLIEGPMQDRKNAELHQAGGCKNRNPFTSQDQKNTMGKIHIANCGNTHAVLCKNGKGHRLTKDHSTSNPKERRRVLKAGGKISVNKQHGLVEGLMSATRGLGHHGDLQLKKSVIPVPYSVSLPIDDTFQAMILATSGIWDVLDEDDVAAIAMGFSSLAETPCNPNQDRERTPNQAQLENKTDESGTLGKETQDCFQTEKPSNCVRTKTEKHFKTKTDYENLAVSISKKIVETAVNSGAKENLSVITVLLPGLDV